MKASVLGYHFVLLCPRQNKATTDALALFKAAYILLTRTIKRSQNPAHLATGVRLG